jgi:chemotaxis family two-component system response regulator Rcp1
MDDERRGHASCFITKPIDFNQFIEVVGSIEELWLTIAKLPAKDGR